MMFAILYFVLRVVGVFFGDIYVCTMAVYVRNVKMNKYRYLKQF